ncbi:glycoside hydrolase family 32 protein [Microlunatus speluncae]|uniref:glycoside hydrolase family 32 protein n=1 Tax=Microlunatus speluncae TaxID=2594267 RepID=UPI00137628D6|nr:glycoside hydrolase family 32 protein [Microlunatus speluncae]
MLDDMIISAATVDWAGTADGTRESAEFVISRDYLTFTIAGSDYEFVSCLDLMIDGAIVRSETGRRSPTLEPATWRVSDLRGRTARLRLVDRAAAEGGRIEVGPITQTDRPAVPPVTVEPLYREAYRPQFHFTARQWAMTRLNPQQREEGWLNDLNGLVFYDGEYHLFAQRWNKCWIHAVSEDLVRWTELEPAFFEEALGTGVQSGSCVIDYQNSSGLSPDPAIPPMVAFWSRCDNRSQCLSYSLDHGRTWTHYAGNPIFDRPERDPIVFRDHRRDRWAMVLYGDQQYHVLTSDDLLHWTDTGQPIADSFECPDLFELPVDGDHEQSRWVLVRGDGQYSVGTFDGERFQAISPVRTVDLGENFYATQSWGNTDTGDGRRIQVAWMRDGVFPDMPFNQQVSFPCELSLRSTPDGLRLHRRPIRELETLVLARDLPPGGTLEADEPWELELGSELAYVQLGLRLEASARLMITTAGQSITLTRDAVIVAGRPTPLTRPVTEIALLLDRTSTEIFVNDGELSITRCRLPAKPKINFRAEHGAVRFESVDLAQLTSAWPDDGR